MSTTARSTAKDSLPSSARIQSPSRPDRVSREMQRLGSPRVRCLAEMGIRSVRDLLDYKPLRVAQLLVSAARSDNSPSIESFLKPSFAGQDHRMARSWPLSALKESDRGAIQHLSQIGIKTIGDLADLGLEAQQIIADLSRDNGFDERPSAPSELLPGILGAVSSVVRFSSFVKDAEVRNLRFDIDERCYVALPITGVLTKHGRTASVSDIFTEASCPTICLGYLCDHRQRWINLGTHLGEVVHSVSLAPGESRNIAFVNWRRRQLTALEEHTSTNEMLTATFVQNRALEEVASAVAREHQAGATRTEANTSVTAGSIVGAGAAVGGVAGGITGAVIGGILATPESLGTATILGAGAGGLVGAGLGGAAGAAAGGLVYAGANALGMIESASEGDREIIGNLQQRITLSTSQHASATRSLWSTVVVEDTQAESVSATTSNISNYNHMHALNMEYFEVLQRYLVHTDLQECTPLMYLPFSFFDFVGFKFIRDYWEAVRDHIDDEQLREQGNSYFVEEDIPSQPDKLTVPNPPQKPGELDSLRISGLQIDLIFQAGEGIAGTIGNLITDVDLELKFGNSSWSPDPEDGTWITSGLNADEEGKRFNFSEVANANAITGVTLNRSQVFGTQIKFRIRVHSGHLKDATSTLEDLSGQNIVSSRTLPQDSDEMTFPVEWTPAASAMAASTQAIADYNAKVAERNAIIEENKQREAGYQALVDDLDRFKQRLQRLVLRRRRFFTRVILEAIEPEEIEQLLDSLLIRFDEDPDGYVAVNEVAQTTPMAMTSGALVLRLKSLDPEIIQAILGRFRKPPKALQRLISYAHQLKQSLSSEDFVASLNQSELIYMPTGGLFSEAILGRANAAEYIDIERYFNWQDSPIPHQAPNISDVGTESRFQSPEITVNQPADTLNLINPVGFPDPTGLKDVLAAVQNGNMFRDMSKATELAGVIGNLSSLADSMGKTAAELTGDAAEEALQSATKMGELAGNLAQSMMEQAFKQAGAAFDTLTKQGAALNKARNLDGDTSNNGGGSNVEGDPGDTSDSGSSGMENNGDADNPLKNENNGNGSLQNELFDRLYGTGGNPYEFANYGANGDGNGNASPQTPSLNSVVAEYPALDLSISEPQPRSCCALFPGGVLGLFKTDYLDPDQVAGHEYGSSGLFPDDPVGHVYTARGGFVDLGHVRDLADMTRFLTTRALATQKQGGSVTLVPEGGTRRIEFAGIGAQFPDVELAAMIGCRTAYDLAIWHEIFTWFTNIRYSSFSPEDNYSNLLGTILGASASVNRKQTYNDAMDNLLDKFLDRADSQLGSVAKAAVQQVKDLWYDGNDDLLGPLVADVTGLGDNPDSVRVLLRRHLEPTPTVTPWLVTDLHGRSFEIVDPVAGVVDRTIDFELGGSPPQPIPLTVPVRTASGKKIADFYTLTIDVDTEVVDPQYLPAGRNRITPDDFAGIIQRMKPAILERFPGGASAIGE